MLKILIIAVSSILVFISCSTNEPTGGSVCFPLNESNEWTYSDGKNIITDRVTDSNYQVIDKKNIKTYRITRSNGSDNLYSWQTAFDNNNIWFSTEDYFQHFIGNAISIPNNIWLRLTLCDNSNSFFHDSIPEVTTIIIDGMPVEIVFYHHYELSANLISKYNITIKNKSITCHIYKCNLKYQEKYKDIIRNSFNEGFEIWFANGVGFVKYIDDKKTLNINDYKLF